MANLSMDSYDSQNIDALVSTLVSNQQPSETVDSYLNGQLNGSLSPINDLSSNSFYDQQNYSSLANLQMNNKKTPFNRMPILNMASASSMSNGQTNLSNVSYMIGDYSNNTITMANWPNLIKNNGVNDSNLSVLGFNNSNGMHDSSYSTMSYQSSPTYNSSNYNNLNQNNLNYNFNNNNFNYNNVNYQNLNYSINSNQIGSYCNNTNSNRPNGNYVQHRRPIYNQQNNSNNQNMDHFNRQRRVIQTQRKNNGHTGCSQLFDASSKNQNQYSQTNNRPSYTFPTESNGNLSNMNRPYNQTNYSIGQYKTNYCNQSNNIDRVPNLRSIKGQQSKKIAVQKAPITESEINSLIDQLKDQLISLDQKVTELIYELNGNNEADQKMLPISASCKLTLSEVTEMGIDLFGKIDNMLSDHKDVFENLDKWLQTSYCALQCWLNLIQALRFSIQRKLIKLKSDELNANLLVESLNSVLSIDDGSIDEFHYAQLQLLIKSTREANKSIWCMFVIYKFIYNQQQVD